ncbi:flagellar protein FliS [Izhakiella capsodis]|uniref:Flagellar secretion chaperone FliS n=1 Tax=Izhakiella capsodis TaxID=1367852 RepID=A0A1I5AMU5_9GAMM|nr:flagellar export chaperone FliS [Izhakiella capsodis]SFN63692.1 flagellar protein FliS [Izhakiella capsodis]
MYSAKGTHAYEKIGVESAVMSASQPQLITLLFDGTLSALVRARLFMQDGNLEGKGLSISKAINIIDNGLKLGLAQNSGDDLADNLTGLYTYMVRRLLQANLHNDVAALEEVEGLLRGIADAWKEVNVVSASIQDGV